MSCAAIASASAVSSSTASASVRSSGGFIGAPPSPLWGGQVGAERRRGGEAWSFESAGGWRRTSPPWPLRGLSLPRRGGREQFALSSRPHQRARGGAGGVGDFGAGEHAGDLFLAGLAGEDFDGGAHLFALPDLADPPLGVGPGGDLRTMGEDRKSTRLNSSHTVISYAVFC